MRNWDDELPTSAEVREGAVAKIGPFHVLYKRPRYYIADNYGRLVVDRGVESWKKYRDAIRAARRELRWLIDSRFS